MEELAGKLTVLNRNRGWNLELATCGENLDLGKYRISRNRCIDGDLIARLAWKDKELMSALGVIIQEMPSPAFFDMNDLPYGAVILPSNKYFVSNHKRIRDNAPHADVWQPRISGNTIPAPISANTAMQIQVKIGNHELENAPAEPNGGNDNRKVKQQTRKKLTVKRLKDSSSFSFLKSSMYSTFLLRSMLGTTLPL